MKRWTLIGSVALSLGLALAACGGDDEQSEDAATGESTTAAASRSAESPGTTGTATGDAASPSPAATAGSSPSASATTGASPAASPSASPTAASSNGDGGSNPASRDDTIEAFREIIANTENERFHVVYIVDPTAGDEAQTGTWELTQDPPRSAAIVSYEGEQAGKFFIIKGETESYTCFESGDEGQCVRGAAPNGLTGVSAEDAISDLEDSESVAEIAGRMVLGRDARCFEYTGSEAEGSSVICVDQGTGVLLVLERDDVVIEAIQFDQNIDESVFEPPYDVAG